MSNHKTILFCLLAGILLLSSQPVSAQEKVKLKLAIMPFTLNGADDLAYLKEGVRTMLASRIAARAGVMIAGRSEVERIVADQKGYDAVEVARTLGADLTLTGSITALGSSVSIDANLVRVVSDDSESFFAVAEDQGGIITAVDQLSSAISGSLKGMATRTQPASKTVVSPQPSSNQAVSSGQSQHPDRMFKLAVPTPAPTSVTVPMQSLPVVAPAPVVSGNSSANQLLSATRSQFLDMEAQVIDVGDVFGDGGAQVVVAEKREVTVFRQEGNRLVKIGGLPAAPRHVKIIALNLADLNSNGRTEIYISAVSDNNPYSYAVEWDGRNFVKLFDKQRHYLRPIFLPGKGWGLYGQKAGYEGPAEPGIYKADSRSGSLLTDENLVVPESVNLFEFVMGDFSGDGRVETAVQTRDNDLLLYNSDGDVLWKGKGNYGYTSRFIGPSYSGRSNEQKTLQVPTRLIATDLNGDGRSELVAMANPTGVASLLKTIGSFVSGSIKIMGWNGVAFNDLWSTGEIGSYVTSCQVNVDEPRLYISMVSKKSGVLFNNIQSVVASYLLTDMTK